MPNIQGPSVGHITDHVPTGDSQLKSATNVVQQPLSRNISKSPTELENVEKTPPVTKVMHAMYYSRFSNNIYV